MSTLLGIDIKTFNNGVFQFYQNGFIGKLLEAIGIYHCSEIPTLTKFKSPLRTDNNGLEANRDWTNQYTYVIGMMLYIASNTRSDISFAINQCSKFTHNAKASHETSVKRICWYLQGTKDKGPVFNTSKKW